MSPPAGGTRRHPARRLAAIASLALMYLAVPASPARAVVTLPPHIAKSFDESSIPLNGTTTLRFTVENPNALGGSSLTHIGFTDTLPSGLVVATPNGVTGTCGGATVAAAAGGSQVSMAGLDLAPTEQCGVSVDVTATTVGQKDNSVQVTSDQGNGNPGMASLEVQSPTLAMSFGATWIPLGRSTSLKFTIDNLEGVQHTGVSFSDHLPGGLRVATPNGRTGSCGGGTIVAKQGSGSITLSGATIAPFASCAFSVDVTGTAVGVQHDTAGPVGTNEEGGGATATAVIAVVANGDRVFWSNTSFGYGLSFADVKPGGGGADLTPGDPNFEPHGVAIDSAAGRIYWLFHNFGVLKVSFANLDGTGGGGDVDATGATRTTLFAAGLAIDPAGGRIYWANTDENKISFANLNGSGGGDLDTTGATVTSPFGVAADPATGRIYWANETGSISYANLDDTGGGGDLDTTGATVHFPGSVAIDPVAGRIYWANETPDTISYANLDGTGGGGDLDTTGATMKVPRGIAIDPVAGRIYWANAGSGIISYAKLDGTGGGANLDTGGATVFRAAFPALLEIPRGRHRPAITGGSTVGSTLSCSKGSWAADLIEAFLYRAPERFSYRWTLGGSTVAGATGPTITASSAGTYRCRVRATNAAGSATQKSARHSVFAPPDTEITLAMISQATRKATFRFKAIGKASGFQCALKRPNQTPTFAGCTSPKTYGPLKAGSYTFLVRAFGPGGTDPSPARKTFTIGSG